MSLKELEDFSLILAQIFSELLRAVTCWMLMEIK